MDEDEINYRVLRKIQKQEQNSPKLSNLKYSFYKDVSEYLKSLEDRLKEETSTQKQKILEEEINNTKKIFLSIYEQREKKILLAAISKARGGKPNIENMKDLEKELFEKTLETINNSRTKVLTKDNKNENKKIEEKKPDEKKNEDKDSNDKPKNNNPIVRIKNDVPEFVGTDKKKYRLNKNDIISISPDLCEILCKRDISEKIEI